MSTSTETIEQLANREYKYGFYSDIEAESIPKGLSEDVVRLISAKKEEPEGASFPSRGALAAIAGMPLPMSRKSAGLELFDFARRVLESEIVPLQTEEQKAQLEEGLKVKSAKTILRALEPVLDMPSPPERGAEERSSASMPKRRRGLLRAVVVHPDQHR